MAAFESQSVSQGTIECLAHLCQNWRVPSAKSWLSTCGSDRLKCSRLSIKCAYHTPVTTCFIEPLVDIRCPVNLARQSHSIVILSWNIETCCDLAVRVIRNWASWVVSLSKGKKQRSSSLMTRYCIKTASIALSSSIANWVSVFYIAVFDYL